MKNNKKIIVFVTLFSILGSLVFAGFPVAGNVKATTTTTTSGDAPDVNTLSASSITDNSAVLRGEVDPNGADTDVWFEWGTSSSNLDNDTSREDIGDSSSVRTFDRLISGLDDNTTYYFRAVAENSKGIDRGTIRSFKTDDSGGTQPPTNGQEPPYVTTFSAENVDENSAVLRGGVNPNGGETEAWFEWGGSFSFFLNKSTSKKPVGGGTSFIDFDVELTGIENNRTYWYRAVAENSEGITKGEVKSFRTEGNISGDRPDILDIDARSIRDDSVELICEVDPNGEDTDVWFEWDEDEDDLEDGRGRKTRIEEIDGYRSDDTVEITVRNLDEDKRYYYRCFAENRYGDDESRIDDFRTDDNGGNEDKPDVRTLSAEDVDSNSAILIGDVDPNGEDTDVWFEYGTGGSNLNQDTRIDDIGDGTRREEFEQRVSGLQGNTVYYFRAIAESREGIDRGSIKSFRTDPAGIIRPPVTPPPTIITRVVEVVRETEVEEKDSREALIITLDSSRDGFSESGEIEYTVAYENRTNETFTEAVLIVEIPREYEFVDASPREDDEDGNQVIFEIGTIEPRDDDSFDILFELGRSVDDGDEVEFIAYIEYLDRDKQRVVEVIDIATIGELSNGTEKGNGGFGAAFIGSLGSFFTNPFFWVLILVALIFIIYRYFAILGATRDSNEDDSGIVLQPITPPGPVQQQFPTRDNL